MKIFIAQHPAEAHIVCGLLRQQFIRCEVRGDTLFSVRGEIPFDEASSPYVWLLDLNCVELSKSIVNDYLKPTHQNQPDWLCRHCGEYNEPQFGLCWKCGSESE